MNFIKSIKAICISYLLVLLSVCCAPEMATLEQERYQNMVDVNLTKEQIFNKTLQWMAETFKSSKHVIEYKDLAEGMIIGNASVQVQAVKDPFGSIPPGLVAFTMKIEIKDGKYRLTTYHYAKNDLTTTMDMWYHTKETIEDVNQKIAELDKNLYYYLTSAKNDTW